MNLSQHQASAAGAGAPRSVFSQILVGVDGTESGFEACRQAARFAETDAMIEAVTVVHLADAVHAGLNAARLEDQMQRDAEVALDKAIAILGDTARRKFINGYIADALLHEIEDTPRHGAGDRLARPSPRNRDHVWWRCRRRASPRAVLGSCRTGSARDCSVSVIDCCRSRRLTAIARRPRGCDANGAAIRRLAARRRRPSRQGRRPRRCSPPRATRRPRRHASRRGTR